MIKDWKYFIESENVENIFKEFVDDKFLSFKEKYKIEQYKISNMVGGDNIDVIEICLEVHLLLANNDEDVINHINILSGVVEFSKYMKSIGVDVCFVENNICGIKKTPYTEYAYFLSVNKSYFKNNI
jgi:hypothetical protein